MFPRVLAELIAEYADYALLSWIDEEKLNWSALSANPAAIDLLKKYKEKINWNVLSRNPAIFTPNPRIVEIIMAV